LSSREILDEDNDEDGDDDEDDDGYKQSMLKLFFMATAEGEERSSCTPKSLRPPENVPL
jgi:hypothetical protein